MRPIPYFLCITLFAFLLGCVKHEIIPAPEHEVELAYSFKGVIDNDTIEMTSEFSNYRCNPTQEKNLVTPPLLSSAIYYSEISSDLVFRKIKIGLGQIQWNKSAGDDPGLEAYNAFFSSTSNMFPLYKDNLSSGFKVTYTDENNIVYESSENSSEYKDVKFTNISQDSDASGDYSKFSCTLNCYVYYVSGNTPENGRDSLKIQMGKIKGYFKK